MDEEKPYVLGLQRRINPNPALTPSRAVQVAPGTSRKAAEEDSPGRKPGVGYLPDRVPKGHRQQPGT